MQCIWSGDIRKVWDAAQLRSIVDKVAEWFFYIYRPWISTCLEQWKAPQVETRLKTVHELYKNSRRLSQVDIGSTASNKGDGVARISAESLTPSSLFYRKPVKETPPSLFGGSYPGSRSIEATSDSSVFGLGQARSRGQLSEINHRSRSDFESIDRPSDFNPFRPRNSKIGERTPTEGSTDSPTSKAKDRPSSRNNERLSTGSFGLSTSQSNDRPHTGGAFGSTPSKSDGRPHTGGVFGSTPSKSDGRLSPSSLFRPSSGSLFGAPVSNNNTRPSTRIFGSSASNNNDKQHTGGLFDSMPPKNDGSPSPGGPFGAPFSKGLSNSSLFNSDVIHLLQLSARLLPTRRKAHLPTVPFRLLPRMRNDRLHQTVYVPLQPLPKILNGHLPVMHLARFLLKTRNRSIVLAHLPSEETNMRNPGSEAARAGYYYR